MLTDFFIANDEEMKAVCHGWKKPAPLLAEYRTLTATNPFAKEPMTIRTRANPDQPTADEDAVRYCEFRHLPWIAQKGILTPEVAQLACLLVGWDDEHASEEVHGRVLIGPSETEEALVEVHPVLVDRLASLSEDECASYGAEWAQKLRAMNVNALGQSMEGFAPIGPNSDWMTRLSELASLAKRAVSEQRSMYMWMCP